MCFDQTSLPLALRTCSRIDAAVETCRLTLTGFTVVRVADWTMRTAPTATAAAFAVPVRLTVAGELLALETTVSVAVFGPVGRAGVNATTRLQVFPGSTATLQVPICTEKADVLVV